MNRHPFRAICAVAVSAFALLAVCGCAARPEEALNQALEALNAQQAGQFRILNLSEDGESLSVAVEYAFENGAPYFTHQGWDAEGVQSEYQYQNGKLILPEGELPETVSTIEAGDKLGGYRGAGRPADSPVKGRDKQKVKPDIHGAGHAHGHQGSGAVTQTSQHRGQQIIGHYHRKTVGNPQVKQGLV